LRQVPPGLRSPVHEWGAKSIVLVFVLTEDGKIGVGEASTGIGAGSPVMAALRDELTPMVLGRSVYDGRAIAKQVLAKHARVDGHILDTDILQTALESGSRMILVNERVEEPKHLPERVRAGIDALSPVSGASFVEARPSSPQLPMQPPEPATIKKKRPCIQ
jgi:hypothetical protein